jgi:phage/plasmid-associated DNA primase
LSGILNWALIGLKRLRENGRLSAAAAVSEAVAEYRQESNPIAEWLAERTVSLAEADTGASALHADYLAWCKQRGGEPLNTKNFGVELRRLGVVKKRFTEGYRYALGLVYRGRQDEPPPDDEDGVV